ncbi:MAG: hypothetical protein V2A72_03120 [Candidatus Omnitrophota bacterium]
MSKIFNLKDNRGIMLVAAYLVVTVLLILGIAFFSRGYHESKMALRHKYSTQALCLAEAGIERAFYDLDEDFNNDTTPSWADGDINGITCGPDEDAFYALYAATGLGEGTYQVMLRNIPDEEGRIWVQSTGTAHNITRTVQVYLRANRLCVWDNVIFAGTGATGQVINGNVDIRGSVHILGTDLADGEFAIDMSGDGGIGNNYDNIPDALKNKLPDLETEEYNGEDVQTLDATLRVKNGLVGLSGSSTIGDEDEPLNEIKETMDGVYVTDGYGGTQDPPLIYSDNGRDNSYDYGDNFSFPTLTTGAYGGFDSYQEYFESIAYCITDAGKLAQLASINPTSTFNYTDPDGKGSISMNNGLMTVSGCIYIAGAFNINQVVGHVEHGVDRTTVNYTGTASILTTEDIGINANFTTSGDDSFPTNVIGFMTPGDIVCSSSQIDVTGLFYAEGSISATQQTDVAGVFVSNYFDMGAQVPSIFQVPEVINNLPDGLIGSDSTWTVDVVSWQEQ